MANIALLMMGGSGRRVGAPIPKQFIQIKGKPIFTYILKSLDNLACIDHIVIVVHQDWIGHTKKWSQNMHVNKVRDIVKGGTTRSESVLNGLHKANEFAKEKDVVMMFDATHPYVDKQGIEELICATKQYGGATLGQRQYDTCYQIDKDNMIRAVIPRHEVVSGASPEAFLFQLIYNIYTKASQEELEQMTSAGAIALAHHVKMKVCTLHTINLKITYPQDIQMLEKMRDLYFPEETNEK